MRISYYAFPRYMTAREQHRILLKEGFNVPNTAPPEDFIDEAIFGCIGVEHQCSIRTAKAMLKKYGGYAWTEHYERDGGLMETSEITLNGNNSRFKYNRHL
jgi:hypothetical protein